MSTTGCASKNTGYNTKPKLAFLGPIGTYSHQAAESRFSDSVEYVACPTMADVFNTVNADIPLALLPQENSIHGIVADVYDLFRLPDLGESRWIQGTVVLPVQHCLIVKAGQTLQGIKRVISHEQALGQCQRFIKTYLPGATVSKVPSTAAAAEHVSKDPDALDCAAICSSFCASLFFGLEVLRESIQDEAKNFTRFYIITNQQEFPLPSIMQRGTTGHALLRVHFGNGLSIADVLNAIRLPVNRLDRRPSLESGDFRCVYFIEIGQNEEQAEGKDEAESCLRLNWADVVHEGIGRAKRMDAHVKLLGIW